MQMTVVRKKANRRREAADISEGEKGMSLRSMKQTEWDRVLESRFAMQDFRCKDWTGKISLHQILKIREPLYVNCGGEQIKIADNHFSWLQIAFANSLFWITAMFDERDALFEIYVDMTDGNVTDTETPYF